MGEITFLYGSQYKLIMYCKFTFTESKKPHLLEGSATFSLKYLLKENLGFSELECNNFCVLFSPKE